MEDIKCQIKCLNCNRWFDSAIQFGDSKSFFSSTLIGNKQQCQHCGKMTNCNKENMRFSERREDGLLLTYFEGQDALEDSG